MGIIGHNPTQHFNIILQVSLWFSFGFDVKGVQSTLNITSGKCHELKNPLALAVLLVTIYRNGNFSACPKDLLGR